MKKQCLMIVMALMLSACATEMPPLNFSVPNVGPSRHKMNAELKSITVTIARPDEKKGALPVGMEIAPPMWKESLEESLTRHGLCSINNTVQVTWLYPR